MPPPNGLEPRPPPHTLGIVRFGPPACAWRSRRFKVPAAVCLPRNPKELANPFMTRHPRRAPMYSDVLMVHAPRYLWPLLHSHDKRR